MKYLLVQIAVLLMYVTFNDGSEEQQCPPRGLRPVDFPPEYLLAEWRPKYCIDNPVCPSEVDCMQFPHRITEDNRMVANFYGYNKTSNTQRQAVEAELQFLGTGHYALLNVPGLRSVDVYMLYANEHYIVEICCITDDNGVTSRGGWISTKDDPSNTLVDRQLTKAIHVLQRVGLDIQDFYQPTYNNCSLVERTRQEGDSTA